MYKSLIGNRYKRLTVIEFSHSNQGRYWKCLCDCGNITIVNTAMLNYGNTKSCGCLAVDNGRKKLTGQTYNRKEKGINGLNRLYTAYKFNAKRRNRDFILDKEIFKKLTSSNCYYCGKSPTQESKSTTKHSTIKGLEHGKYLYNGLDRIDDNKGYVVSNVIPCCGDCNFMKQNMTYNSFINKIKSVYEFLNLGVKHGL